MAQPVKDSVRPVATGVLVGPLAKSEGPPKVQFRPQTNRKPGEGELGRSETMVRAVLRAEERRTSQRPSKELHMQKTSPTNSV